MLVNFNQKINDRIRYEYRAQLDTNTIPSLLTPMSSKSSQLISSIDCRLTYPCRLKQST